MEYDVHFLLTGQVEETKADGKVEEAMATATKRLESILYTGVGYDDFEEENIWFGGFWRVTADTPEIARKEGEKLINEARERVHGLLQEVVSKVEGATLGTYSFRVDEVVEA